MIYFFFFLKHLYTIYENIITHTITSLKISVAKAPPTEIAPTKNIISNTIMLININAINIQILLSVIKEVVKIA